MQVLDLTRPAAPVPMTRLTTPAMLSPHETLDLNQARGLLVAVLGGAAQPPGVLEVYDVKKDCRSPVLLSTTPVGQIGHEGGFSPDGKTFFASSTATTVATVVAVGLDDPRAPEILWVGQRSTRGGPAP